MFLTISLKLRSSYGVKTKAYSYALLCIYVCPTYAHRGFRYGYRRYKGNTLTMKTTLFDWLSIILRSDLTLLNINMSKKSTLRIFLAKKNLIPFTHGLNLQKISLICLNHEVYKFVIETKTYSTLTTLVIIDCQLICILC